MIITSSLQATIGKEKELEAALQRLRGTNVDISQEASDIIVTFQLHDFKIVYLCNTFGKENISYLLFFIYFFGTMTKK